MSLSLWVLDKIAGKVFEKGFGYLFDGKKENFKEELNLEIDKTIDSFMNLHPVEDIVEDGITKFAFYKSQIIKDELLQYGFFEDYNFEKIEKAFESNPQILKPEKGLLIQFIDLIKTNIKNSSKLKNLYFKDNYREEIFNISNKIDKGFGDLKKEIISINKKEEQKKAHLPKYLPKKPPYYNPDELIGRNETLKKISEELKTKNNVTLVNGIGGIGKTTIALAYVNTPTLMEQYDHIAWITVFDNIIDDTITQLTGSVPDFTYNKGETSGNNFKLLLMALSNINGNNLLVIDNANNLQNLLNVKKNIDALRWKVIITSRTEPQTYNKIPVDRLEKEDAKTLFYRYYKKEQNDELLENLLIKIEYHTLLTELLAKTANESPELNLPKLCEILDNKDLAAEELQIDIVTEHELDEKNRLKMKQLYGYINKIFEATVSNLNEEEKKYLRYFAVLPSQAISFTDLVEYFKIDKKNKTIFTNTLNLLFRKGWLIKEKGTSYKAHSLIQTIAREKLQPDTKNCAVLIDTFKWRLYTKPGDNPLSRKEYVPYAENLLITIKDENIEIATLANNLSTIFSSLGNYKKALEYNLKTITIFEKVFEPNHPSLATSYSNIADTYSSLGNYKKALEYDLKSITILEKVLEPNHPLLATSYNNIAETYRYLGNYKKALEYNLKSITIREKVLEQNHPSLATSYNNIALTYSSLGNYKKALEYNLKAITIWEKVLEQNHPNLATSYLNIAATYYYLINYKQAKYYIDKAVEIYKKVLPQDRPELKVALGWQERINRKL
jgi:tetratricopeptide (TPR) repeat protein